MHRIHPDAKIHPTARIECEHLVIGAGAIINANCRIEGSRVEIGRNFWMDEGAIIGGGSCHDPSAFLSAGDFLHMGWNSQVNIARGVTLGDEVGIGIETKIFTHGAYSSEWDGFPVSFAPVRIGDRSWLPNAWVNPGVRVGRDVVVAARSLINSDLPDGCLAAGIPCRPVKLGRYPRILDAIERERILAAIISEIRVVDPTANVRAGEGHRLVVANQTVFDLDARSIEGPASAASRITQNQLRRHGIRFRYEESAGYYSRWKAEEDPGERR